MCGILGSLTSSASNDRDRFVKALELLRYRGPDEVGYFIDQHISLGCRRLKIIGLENGNQPITNEDNTLRIIFNGAIYNYLELRESLRSRGHIFKTDTDTEVILHLYEEEGVKCLENLEGMFAFAIWNNKDKSLFVARDRFGIKPLFYSHNSNGFIFSSSIKPILKLLNSKPDIFGKALNLYFWLDYVPAPFTIYQGISSLLPAHYLLFSEDKGLDIKKYYSLGKYDLKDRSRRSVALGLKECISDSVKKHLVCDVEPGLFLSGGLDSSILAYHMKEHLGDFKAFNIGFKDSSFDESRYAALIAEQFNLELNFKCFSGDYLLTYLEKIIADLDQPFADHSLLPTCLLSDFSSNKLKLSISGDGGDELFCGYQTYIAHRLFSFYKVLPLNFRENFLRSALSFIPVSDRYFSLNFCLDRFSRSQSTNDLKRHLSWMESFGQERKQLLSDSYEDVEDEYIDFIQDNFVTDSEGLQRIQQFDIYSYLSNDILYKTDFASMRNSLEVRVPYLDKSLVELALSLPDKLKLNNLKNTKYILRSAYKGNLPATILRRKKAGFSPPVAAMLRNQLKDMFNDLIENSDNLRCLNKGYIKDIFLEHLQYGKNNRKILWNILVFFIWFSKNEI